MTDATNVGEREPRKPSKLPLIVGVLLAIAGAAGGYFITSSGLLTGNESATASVKHTAATSDLQIAFVPLDPLTISLNTRGGGKHLRFRAELEVDPNHISDVELIRPRIVDVLNGYLRAVELEELENPASLTRLRAQMLRRVQVVAGEGKINDLLIMEFVVN